MLRSLVTVKEHSVGLSGGLLHFISCLSGEGRFGCLCFGYCVSWHLMDLCMRDFERIRVGQPGVEARGCVLTESFEKLPDQSPAWPAHRTSPPMVRGGSGFSAASPAPVTLSLMGSGRPGGLVVAFGLGFDLHFSNGYRRAHHKHRLFLFFF